MDIIYNSYLAYTTATSHMGFVEAHVGYTLRLVGKATRSDMDATVHSDHATQSQLCRKAVMNQI